MKPGALCAALILTTSSIAGAVVPLQDEPPVDLETYLRSHGLDDLLVAHLEAELRRALGEDQIPIAERLAAMYGEMMDRAIDDEERAVWEQKSRALLEQIPAADTEGLRLNIYKASYLRAERLAELYRLRAVDQAEASNARRIMRELADDLSRAYRQLYERIDRLANLEIGDDEERAARISAEIEMLEPLASQAAYYGAWALYYHAWLASTTQPLNESLELFGAILQAERKIPTLEELGGSMLSYEHMARAVIGVALAHSEAGRHAVARDWLDAVESPEAHAGARRQAPSYKVVILSQARDWEALDEHVEKLEDAGEFNATMARLVAVETLDALSRTTDDRPRRLAARSIARLAELGELAQIIEVADAFDLSRLGDNQFVIMYVLGLQAHERAREMHGSDEPTRDRATIEQYRNADDLLARALARRDVVDYPEAAANARYLLAWSKYYQSRFIDAAEAFDEVAADLSRDDAESARWMRIVSLDRAARLDTSPEMAQRLARAMDEFVRLHPSSQRAYRIRYRNAINASGDPTMDQVESLLQIPPGSDTYDAARHEAERMLYQLFRDASGDRKPELGHRYLDVAMPLYTSAQRQALSSSSGEEDRERYVNRARRLLDVLLTRGVARIQEARRVIDRLESAGAAGLIDIDGIRDELGYRQFQILALTGKLDEAERFADELWQSQPESPFTFAAAQTLFGYSVQDWRAFPNDSELTRTLRRTLKYGQRVMSAFGDEPDLSDDSTVSVIASVAEAAHELARREPDQDARRFARQWFEQLIAVHPRNHRFLKASAEIAEDDGDLEQAVEYWRIAVSGMNASQPGWFEAKYHMIRLLAQTDPDRAREIMRQHALLHPDYGPRPWNERLKSLDEELSEDESGGDMDPGGGG